MTLDPIVLGFVASTATTLISIAALWVSISQGRRKQREYIEGRLNTMAADIARLTADIAKIFGWLEGQRDQRIAKTSPDFPQV